MTTVETIALKLLGIGTTILYGWSLLWISLIFLYNILYRKFGLTESIYFEISVVAFSLIVIGLIFIKLKGSTFWKLLIQDFGLIIISGPLFGSILTTLFNTKFSTPDEEPFVYVAMFSLTILTINFNDRIKTKKPAANNVHVS